MKISKKNCQTLERYGQGAAARRETMKIKTACIKSIIGKCSITPCFNYFVDHMSNYFLIIDLKFPCYMDNGEKEIQFSDRPLITDEEFTRYMSSENGGKGLIWLNYFKDIEVAGADSQVRKYKGHWKANDMGVWEGFGVIQFADGSVYQG